MSSLLRSDITDISSVASAVTVLHRDIATSPVLLCIFRLLFLLALWTYCSAMYKGCSIRFPLQLAFWFRNKLLRLTGANAQTETYLQ